MAQQPPFPLRLYGFLLVAFGSVATLTYKYQDDYRVMGLGADNAAFHHPLLQTLAMFTGEALCLLVSACGLEAVAKRPRGRRFRPLSMLAPAACDLVASVLQYCALMYTFASHVAVLLGVNSLFTGVFAVIFLKQRLGPHQWLGTAFIAVGAAFIGGCSALYESMGKEEAAYLAAFAPNPLLGDLMAVAAQLVRPGQYILEERAVTGCDCSVAEAVGWEGAFGALIGLALVPLFHSVRGPDGLPVDNLRQAATQLRYSVELQVTTAVIVVVACVFNYIGISISRHASSAVRAAVNALRTCSVWLISLWIGWEQLCELQIIGFLCVVVGTSLFNEAIPAATALRFMPLCLGGGAEAAERAAAALAAGEGRHGGGEETERLLGMPAGDEFGGAESDGDG